MSPSQKRSLQTLIGALPAVRRPRFVRVDAKPSKWQRLQRGLGAVSTKPAPPSTWRSIQEAIGAAPRVSRPSVGPGTEDDSVRWFRSAPSPHPIASHPIAC